MNSPTHKLIKENIYSYNVIYRNFQNLPYLVTKEKKKREKEKEKETTFTKKKGERDDLAQRKKKGT